MKEIMGVTDNKEEDKNVEDAVTGDDETEKDKKDDDVETGDDEDKKDTEDDSEEDEEQKNLKESIQAIREFTKANKRLFGG